MAVLVYLALALGMTWPLGVNLHQAFLGYPTIDALDTIMLRGLVSDLLFTQPGDMPVSTGVYYPVGVPILQWTPNLLDHMIGGVFAAALGFPAGDNLFWIAIVTANGLAAHRLGHQLCGNHSGAILVGVAYAASENLLREINLHHAPQALSPFAPLYLAALLRTLNGGTRRDRWSAGIWMGLSGIAYWYTAIFLAFGSLPFLFLHRKKWLDFLRIAGVSLLVASPFLLPYALHLDQLELAQLSQLPLSERASESVRSLGENTAFLSEHGNDLALPFRSTPIDSSNRISLILLLAVGLSLRRGSQRAFVAMALIGFTLALGPILRWGDEAVLLGDTPIWLPFNWLSQLHPIFERLTWPERWGLLIALGLAAAAAHAPRPKLLAALLVVETLLLSGNAPIHVTSIETLEPWKRLRDADGAVFELPLARNHQQAPFVGLHARIHGKPVVNPVRRPPETAAPNEWEIWLHEHPFRDPIEALYRGREVEANAAITARLLEDGIAAVVLNTAKSGGLKNARMRHWTRGLTTLFGEAEDQGALLIWWIREPLKRRVPDLLFEGRPVPSGEAWRRAQKMKAEEEGHPELNSLIEPLWFP